MWAIMIGVYTTYCEIRDIKKLKYYNEVLSYNHTQFMWILSLTIDKIVIPYDLK